MEPTPDSEKESKRVLCNEKRDVRALLLIAALLSMSASAVSVPGSALPSASMFAMFMLVFISYTLLLFVFLLASDVSMPVLGSSAFLTSAFPCMSGVSVSMHGSSTSLSVSSLSSMSVAIPRLSTCLSVSYVAMPVFGSSASPSVSDMSIAVPGLSALPFVSGMSMPTLWSCASPSPSAKPMPGLELSLRPFLHGLLCKYQCLFREDND